MKRFFVVVAIMLLLNCNDSPAVVKANENKISFKIATGRTSSSLITSTGNLYVWGLWGSSTDIRKSKQYMEPTDISSSFNLESNDLIVDVASGEQHSVVLTEKGSIFAFGSNDNLQLISESNGVFKTNPIDFSTDFNYSTVNEKIVDIECGSDFTLALTNNHQLYSFGNNEHGQLGNNDLSLRAITNITSYFDLQDGDYIKKIACGGAHSLILTNNGLVYGFGSNSSNQLGGNDNYIVPTRVFENIDKIIEIACGADTSYVISNKNQIFALGSGSHGQIAGNDDFTVSTKYTKPYEMTPFFPLESEEKISEIYAGYYFAYVKTNLKHYYSFGENSNNQLGYKGTMPTSIPKLISFPIDASDEITNISLAENHALATSKNGKIFAWGSNSEGQLAQGLQVEKSESYVFDITNIFPPVVELSMFSSSVSNKSYSVNVNAYYLDDKQINNIFYCINSSKEKYGDWSLLESDKITIENGEGNMYLHLKIISEKGESYFTSGPFFLDHISPTIQAYLNDRVFEGTYANSAVKIKATDNNEGVIIKYYKDDILHQVESEATLDIDGEYLIYSEDVAGNVSASINIIIDKSFPSILSINNNQLTATSFTTKEKAISIITSEKISCYSIAYPNNKASLVGLNDNENTFSITLKKGINTIIVYDLAGNESESYQIKYEPTFFQDTQLLLIVFGSIAVVFLLAVILTYLLKNKVKLVK